MHIQAIANQAGHGRTGTAQNVAMLVTTLHVLLAIPMYLYVFTLSVEAWLFRHETPSSWRLFVKRYPFATRAVVRTAQISFCAAVAMFTPYFSDFMSLLGTIASESLTFVLPCVFWIKLAWTRREGQFRELLTCLIIAIAGTFCAVFGTADALKAFLQDFRN